MQHDMQVFDSTEAVVGAVADFLHAGLAGGETLLVAMRLPHWNLVAARLATTAALHDAIANGQLTVLDATRTLGRIMWNGMPNDELFEEVVGKLVRQLATRGGRLRIYGDMVDVLAADGNFSAARELERLWSRFAASEFIALFCGYSAASFHAEGGSAALRSIFTAHLESRPQAFASLSDRSPDRRPSRA